MIGRILRIAVLTALLVLIIRNCWRKEQRQSLHQTVKLAAWVFMGAAFLAWVWYVYRGV